jgi:hypothetical protein
LQAQLSKPDEGAAVASVEAVAAVAEVMSKAVAAMARAARLSIVLMAAPPVLCHSVTTG